MILFFNLNVSNNWHSMIESTIFWKKFAKITVLLIKLLQKVHNYNKIRPLTDRWTIVRKNIQGNNLFNLCSEILDMNNLLWFVIVNVMNHQVSLNVIKTFPTIWLIWIYLYNFGIKLLRENCVESRFEWYAIRTSI